MITGFFIAAACVVGLVIIYLAMAEEDGDE